MMCSLFWVVLQSACGASWSARGLNWRGLLRSAGARRQGREAAGVQAAVRRGELRPGPPPGSICRPAYLCISPLPRHQEPVLLLFLLCQNRCQELMVTASSM
jgi:hypothetical protein